MSYLERLKPDAPKRLLALDGGGIRGVLTIEILAQIEKLLQEAHSDESLRLGDYFDYIAGTSTGAILATGLARGMRVSEIRDIYQNHGKQMFQRASLWRRVWYKYYSRDLQKLMQETFGKDTTFGDPGLRCLLMVMLRNASTDSPWPISNNPNAIYNDPNRPDCNLNIPLWQLVRGSTAAPTFFPPEPIRVATRGVEREFVFVDGGVTMSNNPSLQLFLMATLKPYKLEWPTGEDKMLIVSLGTGSAPQADERLRPFAMNVIYNATSLPGALMGGALNQQDLTCRVLGNCRHGAQLDREIGDLLGDKQSLHGVPPLFSYVRYNATLTRKGLDDLGLRDIDPVRVQKLDAVENIADLQRVGRAAAREVSPSHFQGFL